MSLGDRAQSTPAMIVGIALGSIVILLMTIVMIWMKTPKHKKRYRATHDSYPEEPAPFALNNTDSQWSNAVTRTKGFGHRVDMNMNIKETEPPSLDDDLLTDRTEEEEEHSTTESYLTSPHRSRTSRRLNLRQLFETREF